MLEKGRSVSEIGDYLLRLLTIQIDQASSPRSYFKDLTSDDVLKFGRRLLQTGSMEDAYSILAERTIGGMPLYDVVVGPQDYQSNLALAEVIDQKIREERRFGSVVLEFGARTGDMIMRLLEKGIYPSDVFLVDQSISLLNVAEEKIKQQYPRVKVYKIHWDMKLPFDRVMLDPGIVDVVIAQPAFEHVDYPVGLGMYREHIPSMLKNTGILCRHLPSLEHQQVVEEIYKVDPQAEAAGLLRTIAFSHMGNSFRWQPTGLSDIYSIETIGQLSSGHRGDVVKCLTKKNRA